MHKKQMSAEVIAVKIYEEILKYQQNPNATRFSGVTWITNILHQQRQQAAFKAIYPLIPDVITMSRAAELMKVPLETVRELYLQEMEVNYET